MKRFLFILLLLHFAACGSKIDNVERAFYFWKSDEWDFSEKERNLSDSLQIRKLYVKFFEVEYNPEIGNLPISKTHLSFWRIQNPDFKSIVPTVYLRNVVFLKSSNEELDLLADNVHFLLQKYIKEELRAASVVEYQMDCDWTLKSKDKYFYFLQKLKAISGKQISATLRLYPYKYPDKMGVPPVDKVMLMCYNLLKPLDNPGKNSILDLAELKSYLKDAPDYPIHLDVALPVYSWAHVYHNGIFSSVLYASQKEILPLLQYEKPLWYRVKQDTLFNDNTYLRAGDKIKFEEIKPAVLSEAIGLLKQHIRFDKNTTVALFHLDEKQLSNFTHAELSSVYTDFSR